MGLTRLDHLLEWKRPVSPTFEAQIGEQKFTLALKYLPAQAITDSNTKAAGRIKKTLERNGLDDKFLASQIAFRDLEREQNVSLLAEVLVDPESEDGRAPAFSYERLRENILPWQIVILDEKWTTWQTSQDVIGNLTDEDIDELVAAEKKNDVETFTSIILGCGSPLSSMRILVRALANLREKKSSDGQS